MGLQIPANTPVFLGASNIAHMQAKHAADYANYGTDIPQILANPDYIGINRKDNSIEYVKEYRINNEFVKVAVRVTGNSRYFVRSIYVLNKSRVQNFINKGTLIKL